MCAGAVFAGADELGMPIQVESPAATRRNGTTSCASAARILRRPVLRGNEETLDEKEDRFLAQCRADVRATVPDALFNPHSRCAASSTASARRS